MADVPNVPEKLDLAFMIEEPIQVEEPLTHDILVQCPLVFEDHWTSVFIDS